MSNLGHNNPPPDIHPLDERRTELLEEGDLLFDTLDVEDEEGKTIAADYINDVRAHTKAVTATHKADKAPHWAECQAVDATKKSRLKGLDGIVDKLKRKLGEQLRKEQAELDRIAAQERANAERTRLEAEALMNAAIDSGGSADVREAEEAIEQSATADYSAKATAGQRAQTSGDGRAMSLRTGYSAEIVDFAKALEHYKDHPNVREVIQTIANGEARHTKGTMNVPGVKVITTSQAV